jgi:hypothetical protein
MAGGFPPIPQVIQVEPPSVDLFAMAATSGELHHTQEAIQSGVCTDDMCFVSSKNLDAVHTLLPPFNPKVY